MPSTSFTGTHDMLTLLVFGVVALSVSVEGDDPRFDAPSVASVGKASFVGAVKNGKLPVSASVQQNENVLGADVDPSFTEGFLTSLSMIIVSELGDKTFFIAAIMAMRHSRLVIFVGAFAALLVQTVLSTAIGNVMPMFLSRTWTQPFAALLFFIFGIRLLWDAKQMEWQSTEPNEEMEEVLEELAEKRKVRVADVEEGDFLLDPELGEGRREGQQDKMKKETSGWNSGIFLQAFTMTFIAEWGDRSQIATIVMAAAKNPYGVTVGGSLGHFLCTALAVLGGKLLATRISEKTVSIAGGVLFLIFGLHSAFFEAFGE